MRVCKCLIRLTVYFPSGVDRRETCFIRQGADRLFWTKSKKTGGSAAGPYSDKPPPAPCVNSLARS